MASGSLEDAGLVRAQALAIGDLAGRGGEQDDMGAHGVGDFDPHVTDSAQADDADFSPARRPDGAGASRS